MAAAAVATGVLVIPAAPAAAAPAQPAVATPETANGPVTPGPSFTLLTGDTVRLDKAADGTPVGTLVNDVAPEHDTVFQQMNGHLYALTGQVVKLIAQGRLDRQLFDLTLLAKDGYDDAHTARLPVITSYQPGTVTPHATPGWMAKRQSLPTIRAEAQQVRKDSAATALADLTRSGNGVAKVWLDGKAHTSLDVTVPAVGAPSAWEAGYTGKGVKVAVLDTGIDATHPDFAGRVVAQKRFIDGDPADVDDDFGHGTHVASIVAGSGAASGGRYRGVAPDADLLIGKVCDSDGSCPDSAMIAGMQWATEQGAKVVNLSIGGAPSDGTDPLSQALNQASDASGTLFVVAAGNEGGDCFCDHPFTVESPGSADRALTVGALTKTAAADGGHRVASYSSWGPRLGDRAVKPEISAPGGDGSSPDDQVIAARAAHAKIGTAVDQYHTAMSGTSMATPHVTGGAVLVAQEHPDWTRDELKDALVSAANPGDLIYNPLPQQGAGMLDLKQATANGLVATGTLNLGTFTPPYAKATGTVTFRNPGTAAVHADLGVTLYQMDAQVVQSTAVDMGDAVTVSPSAVDVPAGGSVTATVSVDLSDTDLTFGTYYGFVLAKVAGADTVRTTIGFTKNPLLAKLSVRGIDVDGVPETTSTQYSVVNLMDLDTGQVWLGWFEDGVANFDKIGADPRLPFGKYAVLGSLGGWSPAPVYRLTSISYGGDPELDLTKDTTLTIDARQGKQVRFNTDRPSEPASVSGTASVQVSREIRDESGVVQGNMGMGFRGMPEVDLIPGGHAATTGAFTVNLGESRQAPALTMSARGSGVPATLHALYPYDYYNCVCLPEFRSPGSYPVVDAGTGTPAELAAANVAGKLAIVHEQVWTRQPPVEPSAAAAAAAGAAGVLYIVHDSDPNVRYALGTPAVPVAVFTHDEGEQLAAAAKAGPVTITTGGSGQFPPYVYALSQRLTGRFPDNATFEANPKTLATVIGRYHADSADLLFGAAVRPVKAPVVRTEYYSPGARPAASGYRYGVTEYHMGAPLEAGQKVTVDYLTGPIAPGPVSGMATFADSGPDATNYLTFQPELSAGDRQQWLTDALVSPKHLRYLRNGQVLCEQTTDGNWGSNTLKACQLPATSGPGRYQAELDQTLPYRGTSTSSHSVWDFDVTFAKPGESAPALPMVTLTCGVPLDLMNSVAGGSTYTAKIHAGYQNGYTGTGPFTMRAWVSNDGGATWTDLGTHKTNKANQANFDITTPKGTKTVTLRVKATDAAGNSVDQTIDNAWNIH